MPRVGFEPTSLSTYGSEPYAYASSATAAREYLCCYIIMAGYFMQVHYF